MPTLHISLPLYYVGTTNTTLTGCHGRRRPSLSTVLNADPNEDPDHYQQQLAAKVPFIRGRVCDLLRLYLNGLFTGETSRCYVGTRRADCWGEQRGSQARERARELS